jgi:hypothetical protein
MPVSRDAGSFRDPAGYIFERDGVLYRLVTPFGRAAYDQLMRSGLYAALASSGRLIPHEELGERPDLAHGGIVLQPRRLRLVTYPYEWAFSALRDAALLTLSVASEAARHGMRLKDASVFNIQFDGSRPIFIDTLSFDAEQPGPWPAYHQFCQHFLAPLAMMALRDVRLGKMFRLFPDGIPLTLASSLLPAHTWLRPGLLMHLHLHAQAQARLSAGARGPHDGNRRAPRPLALFESLQATVKGLKLKVKSPWIGYASAQDSYTMDAQDHKTAIVEQWTKRIAPSTVWDLGANTGRYSRLVANAVDFTVALEDDAACVEEMYVRARAENTGALMPLVFDLAAPSPAIGWANEERSTLLQRGTCDLLLALAVVHHLAIARGIPLPHIADLFARIGRYAIVEFVPKTDPMTERLLAHRPDIFSDYTQAHFEAAFGERFDIHESVRLRDSQRTVYLMARR